MNVGSTDTRKFFDWSGVLSDHEQRHFVVQTHEKIECTSTHEPMQTWLQVLDTLVHAGSSQLELIIEVQQITKLFHIKYNIKLWFFP